MSPFLFILVSYVLSPLLLHVELVGCIVGLKLNIEAPQISHLFFADDISLFGQATVREMSCFKECLDMYSAWFGQVLNMQKSAVHFNKNTPTQVAIYCCLVPKPLFLMTFRIGFWLRFMGGKPNFSPRLVVLL